MFSPILGNQIQNENLTSNCDKLSSLGTILYESMIIQIREIGKTIMILTAFLLHFPLCEPFCTGSERMNLKVTTITFCQNKPYLKSNIFIKPRSFCICNDTMTQNHINICHILSSVRAAILSFILQSLSCLTQTGSTITIHCVKKSDRPSGSMTV